MIAPCPRLEADASASSSDDLCLPLRSECAHGEVLDDSLLDVIEARMVVVEHMLGTVEVDGVVAARAPRQLEDPVEPVDDPGVLGALCAGALETIDLLGDCVAHSLAHVEGVELRAVLVDDVVIALAELLADRGELLAEQVLTVLLVDALGDVGADRFGDTQLGEVFPCPRLDQLDASRRIDGVQHGKTLVGVEVGPGCDPVGELARGLGGLQQLRKTARVAQPGDLGEHGSQLTNCRLETG